MKTSKAALTFLLFRASSTGAFTFLSKRAQQKSSLQDTELEQASYATINDGPLLGAAIFAAVGMDPKVARETAKLQQEVFPKVAKPTKKRFSGVKPTAKNFSVGGISVPTGETTIPRDLITTKTIEALSAFGTESGRAGRAQSDDAGNHAMNTASYTQKPREAPSEAVRRQTKSSPTEPTIKDLRVGFAAPTRRQEGAATNDELSPVAKVDDVHKPSWLSKPPVPQGLNSGPPVASFGTPTSPKTATFPATRSPTPSKPASYLGRRNDDTARHPAARSTLTKGRVDPGMGAPVTVRAAPPVTAVTQSYSQMEANGSTVDDVNNPSWTRQPAPRSSLNNPVDLGLGAPVTTVTSPNTAAAPSSNPQPAEVQTTVDNVNNPSWTRQPAPRASMNSPVDLDIGCPLAATAASTAPPAYPQPKEAVETKVDNVSNPSWTRQPAPRASMNNPVDLDIGSPLAGHNGWH